MNTYKHLFFDLDHTLWDYDRNTQETLQELWEDHKLLESHISVQDFIDRFHVVNYGLWDQYNRAEIDKDTIRKKRFTQILNHWDIDQPDLAEELSMLFLQLGPHKPHLIDGALDLLEKLKSHYTMSIVSNGFDKTQASKLKASGIEQYFEHVITSETTGKTKPNPEIFEHACKKADVALHHILMIGDNVETDIHGAHNFGLDSVLFDPHQKHTNTPATFRVKHLSEIEKLL